MGDFGELTAWVKSNVPVDAQVAAIGYVPVLQLSEMTGRKLIDWHARDANRPQPHPVYLITAISPPDPFEIGSIRTRLIMQSGHGRYFVFLTESP